MKKFVLILISLLLVLVSCTESNPSGSISDDKINLDDVREQINYANTDLVKGLIHVKTTSYNTGILGNITTYSSKGGTGVIFYEDEFFYYYITNNHVTYIEDGFNHVSYEGYDCYCEKYESTLLFNDANYDLSILKMKKGTKSLHVFKRAQTNPSPEDIIISMGHPNNVINVVTIGYIENYQGLTIVDGDPVLSNVTFPIIKHNAPTDSGSSGGALINLNYELVGINYACLEKDDKFIASYSVPIEKVNEFLNNTIFKVNTNE